MTQHVLNETFRQRLDAVIHGQPKEKVPELVKAVLIDSLRSGSLDMPSRYTRPVEGSYARRLLHRDADGEYTIVVMTWGPDQKTALHDHAVNIPAGEIPARAGELPRDAPIVTICEGGYRSSLAASLLAQEGIAPLANVTGGMAAYRAAKEVTT